MHVAATGLEFVIVVVDVKIRAHVVHERFARKGGPQGFPQRNRHRAIAAQIACSLQVGHQIAHHAAHAGGHIAHGCPFGVCGERGCKRQVGSNLQALQNLVGRAAKHPGDGHRRSGGRPHAMAMCSQMTIGRSPHPRCDLITQHQRGEETGSCYPVFLRGCQKCGEHL